MKRESTLHVLKNELKFVQKGGYRAALVWRAPLVFEDSPTCPKQQCSACPDTNCVLKFVQKGGYRAALVWRAPLVFEDSPTCPKQQCSACPDTNCVLMSFVPTKCHYEAV